ncbi:MULTISPECIES: hypothetical protein [Kocuria]|jgi:hypothetical protein|uniref:hypothetical protein n=1 Tax=Kocuria TaxID=57493 RepID=UPI00203CF126|nr:MULTISPECIES: hypothetical protein [Kocuria]MCM3689357.1 hypothetical protein [Kocuria rosea]
MKHVTSVALCAGGAWLAGTATAVVGLAALQARLPTVMTRWHSAVPDVERALVLLGTGECAPDDTRAERLRSDLERRHGRPVVYVDLTVRPGAPARQVAQARRLADTFHADHVLDHDVLRHAEQTAAQAPAEADPEAGAWADDAAGAPVRSA